MNYENTVKNIRQEFLPEWKGSSKDGYKEVDIRLHIIKYFLTIKNKS